MGSRFGRISLLWFAFALSSSVYASDQSVSVYNELESSPYKLVERLPTVGSSALVIPEAYTKPGIWAEDRFIFPGASEDSEVLITGDKIEDKPIEIIQLQLQSNLTRILKFSEIQAKPRLVLQFKAPPQELADKSVRSIYVKLYIGKRLLDRLRLTPDSEWVRKEYALSNAQFLKQKLSLTLNMTSDSDQSMLMLFGYLKN